ncbi:MAG: hypothetical protein AAGA56_06410, partial [Myxococcota bacterium]
MPKHYRRRAERGFPVAAGGRRRGRSKYHRIFDTDSYFDDDDIYGVRSSKPRAPSGYSEDPAGGFQDEWLDDVEASADGWSVDLEDESGE